MNRSTLIVGAVLLATLGGSAAADATPAKPAPITSTTVGSLTVTGQTTLNGPGQANGPVTVQGNGTDRPLTIRGHGGAEPNLLEVFDYLGNPIFSVPRAGGPAVSGDNLRVLWPDVFTASITLHMRGSITLGGPAGVTLYSCAADPNVTPPAADQAFRGGDRCMATFAPFDTSVYDGARWVVR